VHDHTAPTRRRRPSAATVALAVGALGSGAANVAWTWELGPVRVVAGLFATALVPVSLHLWPRVPITGVWTRIIRALVMGYICVAAAIVNLAHSAQLLTTDPAAPRPVAEDLRLAILLITAVEGVMVMATLAKRRRPEQPAAAQVSSHTVAALVTVARLAQQAQQQRPTARRTRTRTSHAAPAPTPAPEPEQQPEPEPEREQPAGKVSPREWAEAHWPVTGAEIKMATGCSKAHAYRIAADLKREKAAS
jgi:Vesicle coat complex COPII, subunit SEC24/subunit SFB2/subunit SFB3